VNKYNSVLNNYFTVNFPQVSQFFHKFATSATFRFLIIVSFCTEQTEFAKINMFF